MALGYGEGGREGLGERGCWGDQTITILPRNMFEKGQHFANLENDALLEICKSSVICIAMLTGDGNASANTSSWQEAVISKLKTLHYCVIKGGVTIVSDEKTIKT